jgi:ParB-like chromosome segregation protein Spo0J
MSEAKIAFEKEIVSIPLANLLPVRVVENVDKAVKRFSCIMSSIQEVGVIEPLAVFPNKAKKETYFIVDGNLRYHALQKIGVNEAQCIIADQNDSFTYNARICRMSPIQEHRMVAKAVKSGVPLKRLAATLNLTERHVQDTLNLLRGLHPGAVELLESRHMSHKAIKVFKRVKGPRQVEMAEMMVSSNDFSAPYAEAILEATSEDMLVEARAVRKMKSISKEEEARLREEMRNLETDFKSVEESYGDNFLKLTTARGYLKSLLSNAKVIRWLTQRHPEIATEFETIVASEAM